LAHDSEFEVRWPRTDQEIIELAEAYMAREAALASREQLPCPPLQLIHKYLDLAHATLEVEGDPRLVAEQATRRYEGALEEARPLLNSAALALRARYEDDPLALTEWGLEFETREDEVCLAEPQDDATCLEFLESYIMRMHDLDEDERLEEPPLERMQELYGEMEEALERRQAALALREGYSPARRLLDLLQVAAANLVTVRFEGQLTEELALWGYELVRTVVDL
jgi:hypothetical protein